ncbi:hypothetical protein GPL15_08605 [Clostridium sp. MCC353]|uniref:anti-sigma-I factor RsgI family protein n=1 Tax=Clostridium sp. MCC353 TaxID=2592646 RepID=UPI001C01E9CD|nr:hypothetical protein [Clostridium sp. MCC353]MBT9776563.1 hypothetical protein [Clostridium sp. MCC353]
MNREIEDSLKRSMEQLPHPSFEKIADIPVIRMQEHDEITRQDKNRVYWYPRGLALACACLLLLIGTGWFANFRMIYSIVDVDVNPSLEIMVSRREKVLSVKAKNKEAAELLEGRNYRGWDITEMVESLVDDLALQGYLTDTKNVILLSVNSKSQRTYSGLQSSLPQAVSGVLADYGIVPKLFMQKLDVDKEMEKQAEQYHISLGRQQLISLMMKQDPSLKEEELACLKVEELVELAEVHGIRLDGIEVWQEEKDGLSKQGTRASETEKTPDTESGSQKVWTALPPAAAPETVPPASMKQGDDDKFDDEDDDNENDEEDDDGDKNGEDDEDEDTGDEDMDEEDWDGKTRRRKDDRDDDDEHWDEDDIDWDDDKNRGDGSGRSDKPYGDTSDDSNGSDHSDDSDSDDSDSDGRDFDGSVNGSGRYDNSDRDDDREDSKSDGSDSDDSDSDDSDSDDSDSDEDDESGHDDDD